MVENEDLLMDETCVAVIFKREFSQLKQRNVFLPFEVVRGSLSSIGYMFIDEKGYTYHYIGQNFPGNSFAFRTSLVELECKYQTTDFSKIQLEYLEEVREKIYYDMVLDGEPVPIIVGEDKKTHKLTLLDDLDYQEWLDFLYSQMGIVVGLDGDASGEKDEDIESRDMKKEEIHFNPHKLTSEIKKKVIAQDTAIETIAINIWNNFKLKENHNNILVIGNTGVGKTEIFRVLAKKLNIPFYQASMAGTTGSGYIGASVTDILEGLLLSCNNDVKKAEHAIVFLDEIDKITKKEGEQHEITSTAIQDELLKMLEDGVYMVSVGNSYGREKVMIHTKDITFIGAGAFQGILDMDMEKPIGFIAGDTPRKKSYHEVTNESFIRYGYKPEFIGRFPVIVVLEDLSKENLITIMKESENNILKDQIQVFQDLGIEVKIKEEVYEAIASEAILKKTGARGLNSAINRLFSRALYQVADPNNSYNYLEITKETVLDPSNYILLKKNYENVKKRTLQKK